MDKEQAKFILQCFRPDGGDALDTDFAEALELATKDRELGEWLVKERSTDAAFAAALESVEIPDSLRESIFASFEGDASEEFSELDAAFVGALASVQPPEGLRDQILMAMQAEEENIVPLRQAPRRVRSWMRGAAVAAALVLGAFVAVQMTSGPPKITGAITAHNVEQYTIQALGKGGFGLDREDENPVDLVNWLNDQDVPTPEALPVGLSQVPGVGCKVLELNEKKAALICFKLESGDVVHMVTLNREDVGGALASLAEAKKNCHGCEISGWSSMAWGDEGKAFVIVSKMKPEELAKVF